MPAARALRPGHGERVRHGVARLLELGGGGAELVRLGEGRVDHRERVLVRRQHGHADDRGGPVEPRWRDAMGQQASLGRDEIEAKVGS